ncbi:TPA: helix-turn-helix transcriptional regulator [Burkholderia cenocepacia]|uniref:helix-turn-helix domain-containing protein n=1 Tax=Burkholderia cenocepacia TaxID=95486 RepID=UPI001B9FBC40|nr:helix-turn-helix transcriptional regulator [Burkholderia cenocepacia]MBR8196338.1 helix-turn-helix transcriptional regulator [Burkholderia cenocepacia]HDV6327476.1 helix-turn-helix transcriptional regulator [Burkholderia cenocepacia]HDV6351348.1 helix-turn-helix transcriptional regulator [Burkholderia cenocepacia]
MTIDTYGKRLRSARKAARLTQKQLADKVGLQQATISELENDEYSGSAKTAEMAEVLGVNALWLAQGTGDRLVGAGAIGTSGASLAAAVIAASAEAKDAIRAILRADRAGESPETFKLVQRLFPERDEEAKLER